MKYERNIGGEEFVAEAISRRMAEELNKQARAVREVVTKFSELGLVYLMRFGNVDNKEVASATGRFSKVSPPKATHLCRTASPAEKDLQSHQR